MGRQTAREIERIAADWTARVDRGLSPSEQAALDDWLAADVRHVGAFGRVLGIALHTERARALGSSSHLEAFAPRRRAWALSRRRLLLYGGGAVAASVAVGVGVATGMRRERYDTRRGEIRVVPLADGSVVTLNTASKISVAFTSRRRRLRLIQGEALFDVAKDRSRPFIVNAGAAEVRAVGTSFAVRRLDESPVRVLVREGVVEVKRRVTAERATTMQLTANRRTLVSTSSRLEADTVSPLEVGRELAWRSGRIAFEGETLQEAANAFARYSATRIVIDDPLVAQQGVVGLYQANDPIGFAQAVAVILDLKVEVGAEVVRLSR